MWPHLQEYWSAFHELSSERQIGMGMGPIPVSKIKAYGRDDLDLDGEALDRFVSIIRQMDGEYLEASNPKPGDKKDKRVRDEVAPDDTTGVKSLLGRLAEQNKKPSAKENKKKP